MWEFTTKSKLYFWVVLQKSHDTESNKNKMHVDGDETETPETTAPLKSKVRDHTNRVGFKT